MRPTHIAIPITIPEGLSFADLRLRRDPVTIQEPLVGWGESTHALILREDERGNDCGQHYHVALS